MRLIAAVVLLLVSSHAGAMREGVGADGKPEVCFGVSEMRSIVDEYGDAVRTANQLMQENAALRKEVEKLRSTLST